MIGLSITLLNPTKGMFRCSRRACAAVSIEKSNPVATSVDEAPSAYAGMCSASFRAADVKAAQLSVPIHVFRVVSMVNNCSMTDFIVFAFLLRRCSVVVFLRGCSYLAECVVCSCLSIMRMGMDTLESLPS